MEKFIEYSDVEEFMIAVKDEINNSLRVNAEFISGNNPSISILVYGIDYRYSVFSQYFSERYKYSSSYVRLAAKEVLRDLRNHLTNMV